MKRIIKFRGKDKKTGKWVYGDLTHSKGFNADIPEFMYNRVMVANYEVDEDTVGQFTGLKDKNGKEIYEGDIIECVSWNEYFSKDGQPTEQFRRKMYVDFRRGGFRMVEPMPEPIKYNEWDIICNGDIVIIGNIYDDHQLIDTN